MVLQQGANLPIWGWAEKDETVTVSIAGQTVSAKAGDDGRWQVTLGKLAATPESAPLVMTIKGSSGDSIALENVLVGEVWLCSGQSNMEMGVGAAKNGQAEVAAAKHPGIRLFWVPKERARQPADDVATAWEVCTPTVVGSGGFDGFSAAGYFFGRDLQKELKVPVGLIFAAWSGTPAEEWTSKKALKAEPSLKSLVGQYEISSLYNGMIAPLIPFAIRGAVWYQGEANVGRGAQYQVLLPTLIRNWRTDWAQGDFPFGIVQIAPFFYGGDGAAEAEIWEAQLKTIQTVANTGIALTMDIGDLNEIHPKNKQDVGHRLALWALAKTYDRPIVYSGPIYKSMTIEGEKIRIAFDHVGGGLVSRDGKPLTEFTIAGADKNFLPAVAEIDGSTVVVVNDAVTNPVAVRFAFSGVAQPNLANKEGLPAAPFRTDK
ncbi:MAG TPA: sialate O-acetylesterase [Pirellulales bacterium]|jgi:sialate O-acetylesterase|nr:sialate O-acetylesterase [Pirellulales bacterium]